MSIQSDVFITRVYASRFDTEASSSAEFLGMGNAGINSSRGSYSVFYNPANLASNHTKLVIEPINLSLESNEGLRSQGLLSSYSSTMSDLSGTYSKLKNAKDTFVSSRFSVFPNVTMQYISLGLLYETNRGARVRNVDGGMDVRVRDRFGPVLGVSFRLFKGVLRLGGSLKLLTVGNSNKSLTQPIATQDLTYAAKSGAGSGVAKDVGMTLTLPFRYLPSFSLVARDIGNTKFNLPPMIKFGNLKAENQQMTFDASASFIMYFGKRMVMTSEFDYKDLTNRLKGNPMQRMRFGLDFGVFDFVHFRAGIMNGYFTGGVGFHTRKASLNFAVYNDEFGDRFRGQSDQRAVVQFTWGIY